MKGRNFYGCWETLSNCDTFFSIEVGLFLLATNSFYFFSPHTRICLLILERKEKREGGGER